jgi:GNAT superfamily N-acetyltransferase
MDPARHAFRIRPIAAGDRDELSRFYGALSTDSLIDRFHGACRGIDDDAARTFCGPDHEHGEGFVAETVDGSVPARTIGHLCLEPTAAGEVEMAVAVAEDERRRGVGRALFAAALAWSASRGIVRLRVSMRVSNGAILGLVRSSGLSLAVSSPEVGIIDVTMDLSRDHAVAA